MSAPLPPGPQRSMLLLTCLMISVMAAVDMTIVSVALPYMAGNLGASSDEITWVVTMFTCGQALVIGVTGFLSRLLGRRRLAIIVVIGFVGSSLACGLAESLTAIVVFRFVQGIFSGPLIPLSQSMLVDAYPAEERSKALSYWSIGVLGGPAFGPVIGGFLAQDLSWRWNFWVNLPIGVLALLLILRYVRAVPGQRVRTDALGLSLLALWVISLQVMLDQGDKLDWFGSREILVLAIVAATFLVAFVWRGLPLGQRNIMNLSLFADGNFAVCSLLVALLGSIFLGVLIVGPELLVGVLGWQVDTAGLVTGLGGGAAIAGSLLGGRLVGVLGIRSLAAAACLFMALGWVLYSRLDLDTGFWQAVVPGATIMFGLMLVFPLLAAQAFANLRPEQRDEGAGMFNFVKTLGFSFGVTFVSTYLYRASQANWTRYVGDLSPTNPGFALAFGDPRMPSELAETGALLGADLAHQATMLSITQLSQTLAVVALCAMPLVLLLRSR